MANEITALEKSPDGTIAILFLYPIATPKVVGGQNVIPTPSAGLPPIAAAVLTAPEKAALDDGTSAFEVVSFQHQGIAGAVLLAKVRSLYASRLSAAATRYATQYQFAGSRFDAA